jgi:hypothetical protein
VPHPFFGRKVYEFTLNLSMSGINFYDMALIEMVMPKMGESIMEATVLSWLKKEGETIEADESVLEVATDKVDTEVPSTHGGSPEGDHCQRRSGGACRANHRHY